MTALIALAVVPLLVIMLAHTAAAMLIVTAIHLRAAAPRSRSAPADLEEWYRAAGSRPADRAPYR